MSPETLQEMYHYAWENFYKDVGQSLRMARLFSQVVKKERAQGSYTPGSLSVERTWQHR